MRIERATLALAILLAAWPSARAQVADRAGLAEAIARWQALPAAERSRQREDFQAWLRMTPAGQARLREAAEALAALDAAQQAALRARFDALDPATRRGWRLGPVLGYYYPRLQPLVGYVDEAERLPLLRCLQSMTPQELELLVRLAFSTPPSARATLRAALVRQPPAQRLGWLMAQVER